MSLVTKSVTLSSDVEEIVNNYPLSSFNQDFDSKINEIVTIAYAMRSFTNHELVGYLTTNEAAIIAEITNGVSYIYNISPKDMLLNSLSDYFRLNQFEKERNIEITVLLEKIEKLTEFQCYVLISNSYEFWHTTTKNTDLFVRIKEFFRTKD